MAIRPRDTLSAYMNEPGLNSRHDNWLFWYLCQYGGRELAEQSGGLGDVRDAMASVLTARSLDRSTVIAQRRLSLVPDSCFEWFEDTRRFYTWISRKYAHNPHNPIIVQNLLKLGWRDRSVLLVDAFPDSVQRKHYGLDNWRLQWKQQRAIGQKVSWVCGEDEEIRVGFLYEALRALRPEGMNRFEEELRTHEDLLIFVDECSFSEFETKHALDSAKRRMSQRNYRERSKAKEKKQLNVMLAVRSIEKLENIAEKHELSKTQVIEILLQMEYEKSLYVPEKLALLKKDFS